MSHVRLWEHCSGKYPSERPGSPELSERFRELWDYLEPEVESLLSDNVMLFHFSDLIAIGGAEKCTQETVTAAGVVGDPGVTLNDMMNKHKRPDVAKKLARYHLDNRPAKPTTTYSQPRSTELGDLIEKAISLSVETIFIGETKARVQKWLSSCMGCTDRKEALNSLSSWAKRVVGGSVDKAKEYLDSIIGESK